MWWLSLLMLFAVGMCNDIKTTIDKTVKNTTPEPDTHSYDDSARMQNLQIRNTQRNNILDAIERLQQKQQEIQDKRDECVNCGDFDEAERHSSKVIILQEEIDWLFTRLECL